MWAGHVYKITVESSIVVRSRLRRRKSRERTLRDTGYFLIWKRGHSENKVNFLNFLANITAIVKLI